MKRVYRIVLIFAVSSLLSMIVSAQQYTWITGLKAAASALGWLMMVIMGGKWIIADSANERAEAKKGMIYIVVGLLIIASGACLIKKVYCDTIQQVGISITCAPPAELGTC